MTGIDYDCAYCGEHHEGTDGSATNPWPALGFHRPDPYLDLDASSRMLGARATDDLCVIERSGHSDCFVRAILSIPVIGEPSTLEYGPWAQIGVEGYLDYVEHFFDPHHHQDYAGHLATAIPAYPNSRAVPVQVITRGDTRPSLVPDSTFGHPLVRDFYDGITRAEAELRIRSTLLPTSGP